MKNLLKISIPVVVLVGIYFGYRFISSVKNNSGTDRNVKKIKDFNGKLHFKGATLDEGVIGQSGSLQVLEKEVERTAPMRSFRNKKRDLLFAIIYNQFVTNNDTPIEKIEFSFKKVSLSPSAILSQYGIEQKYSTKIEFQAFDESEGLARVDGKTIKQPDVDLNNFIWAAHETEVYRYKLSAIDRLLKQKVIAAESAKLKISPQQYEEKYIYSKLPEQISENDVKQYLKKYRIEDTERNHSSARNNLLRKRKKRGVDYILERFVMDLPIKVGLQPPQYKLDVKNEWTPSLGKPGGLRVTLFSGTRDGKTVDLLENLIPLVKAYGGIQFFYRPFFSDESGPQSLTSQMHFCVFKNHAKKFWDFFQSSLGDYKNKTEAQLFAKANDLGMSTDSLKKCLADKKFKEVVDYHLKYAKYLGITIGPVLYIDGEVLQGAIQPSDVEDILHRKLALPAAGVWSL